MKESQHAHKTITLSLLLFIAILLGQSLFH